MTVELISVGTEILLGNIVNTNAAWLSEQCARLGLSCYYQSVVGDNAVRLKEQIQQALNRSDIVILTGGLGPTTDDLTKETAAQLMGKGLVMDMHSLERVEAYFKARRIEMTENNKKQALCPEGAMVLDNDNGTAPGLILEENGKRMILLPGPPNELHPLFERLQAIIDGDLVLDDLKTDIVEVKLWDKDTAGAYPAVREECYIEVVSYGGDTTGYQIPFNVHYTGVKTTGTFNVSTKTFTAST